MRPIPVVIAIAAIAVSAIAAGASAQARNPNANRQGLQQPIRFQAMDANGDGRITRQEWRGSARSFDVHDWNHDGVLAGEEVRMGARQTTDPGASLPNLDSPWYALQIADWSEQHYRALDTNGDGRLSASEWIYDWQTFRRIDHNSDNWVSLAEFLGDASIDDDAEDLFSYLDENNDNRIARNEWHGTPERFDALDQNGDGYLTRGEAIGNEPPPDLFSAVDVNRDQVITRNEWRWSAESFALRDVNGDGRLSRDEFVGMTSDRTSAYRSGYDRGLIEGRSAGREDRVRNQGWDLEGQRELEQADSGYLDNMGPRAEYQAGYREAFRRGYREGWDGAN